MEATLAMIEEKSQRMLGRGHHARLKEVVSDYAAGRIPVEHLLITTRDLLNSPDKVSKGADVTSTSWPAWLRLSRVLILFLQKLLSAYFYG